MMGVKWEIVVVLVVVGLVGLGESVWPAPKIESEVFFFFVVLVLVLVLVLLFGSLFHPTISGNI